MLTESEYLNSLVAGSYLPGLFGDLATAAAWVFAFVCVAMLFDEMRKILRDTGLLQGIRLWEWAAYGLLVMLSALAILAAFSTSKAFYGYDIPGAAIYTGDSNLIVPTSAYVSLFHSENDIRQPLFAVFAAPLTGMAYFLGAWVYRWPTLQMLLLGCSQMLLIFCGGFLLAKTLELTPGKRVCFMLLFCCSHIYLLFIVMMEQYAVAFFWLTVCLYLISRGRPRPLAVMAAGGTLITSLAVIPLAQNQDPRRDFWSWFRGCVKQGLAYVVLIFAFCRLDVILKLPARAKMLSTFTGKELTFGDKVLQFLAFVRNCLLAPDTITYVDRLGSDETVQWMVRSQAPVTGVSLAGVLLLVFVLAGLWLNRRHKGSILCGYWVGFSAAVLVLLGWGTAENGLMLYGLYFGWAYLALLFQLVNWAAEKWRKPWLLPVFTVIAAAVMLTVNVPEFQSLLAFAQTYYLK